VAETTIEIVFNHFPILGAGMARRADEVCEKTAEAIQVHAVTLIQSPPKSGRTYARSAIKRRLSKKDVVFDVTMFGKTRQYTQYGLAVTKSSRSANLYKTIGYTFHRASAPGEAPATDTGLLATSGYTEKKGTADHEVGFTAEYAQKLEFGTPGGKIAPRPFLRPAIEQYRDGFIAAMREATAGGDELPDAAGGGGGAT
jgi:hypothetical protein